MGIFTGMHSVSRPFVAVLIFLAACPLVTYGQEVRGRVLSLTGEGIGGVNILLKGTPRGTATDMNGAFGISLPEGTGTLMFSFVRHRAVEQPVSIRKGYQYYVTIFLARKTQTFNQNHSTVDELPLDCKVIMGTVTDPGGRALAGVNVKQERNSFSAVSNMKGKFRLPVPDGQNTLSISLPGFKSLEFPINVGKGSITVDITLMQDNRKSRKAKSFGEVVSGERSP